MAPQLLNLPISIPWKQIAVSPDMMDTRLGNKRFPFAWRSSLAISAYEPKPEDLPEELCNERITYLKITCSITGYQPSAEETRIGIASFSDLPEEEQARIQRILEEESYFACYGVLLNVAVFPLNPLALPSQPKIELKDYPHIIALEPKMRDFYQAATETGEILTSSKSGIATDKTLSHIDSSESSTTFGAEVSIPVAGIGIGLSGSTTRTNTSTDQDQWSVQTDASRERRETQGTTTQLSQMYNLLAGYHQGTNRATFLMLPRPHIFQPTDHRTFIQGLRQIEGIQEFMLIISRPEKISSLCIEAFLETGHFPEGVDVELPEQEYEAGEPVDFDVGPEIATEKRQLDIVLNGGFEVDGNLFDPNKGKPGRGGIDEIQIFDDDNATSRSGRISNYVFKATSPDTVTISATIRPENFPSIPRTTTFHRTYRVFRRRPKPVTSEPQADIDELLITSRGLQVCIQSGEQCPEVVKPLDELQPPIGEGVFVESIVDERPIKLPRALLTREATSASRTPAMKELLRQIRKTIAGGWRLPSRYPAGEVGFLDTEYFKKRVMKVLPGERLEMPLAQVEGLPDEVIKSLGEGITVSKALELNLGALAKKAGLSTADAARIRRILLGIKTEPKGYADED